MECVDNTNCTTCDTPFKLDNNTCVDAGCPKSMYWNATAGGCKECTSGCLECSDATTCDFCSPPAKCNPGN